MQLGLSSLFPQDSAGLPQTSPSGRYAARFLINGTWRKVGLPYQLCCQVRVLMLLPADRYDANRLEAHFRYSRLAAEMDDALPVSSDGQRMHAAPRSNPQLWPALLEKAVRFALDMLLRLHSSSISSVPYVDGRLRLFRIVRSRFAVLQ